MGLNHEDVKSKIIKNINKMSYKILADKLVYSVTRFNIRGLMR